MRSRALAAVALFDEVPDAPGRELERVVRQWWEGAIVPALKSGANPIARDDAYALYELLHAVRDNIKVDLRESNPGFFKDFPIEHLLSYYPAHSRRRRTTTSSAPSARRASRICNWRRSRARPSWPWWPTTPTRPIRRCCRAG